MKVIYLNGENININEQICSAIGFFDGLHVGHMELVHYVQKIAKEKGYKKALMTFDHHPLYVLGRIKQEKYITSMQDRIKILENEGIDYLFIIRFTKDVAKLSPQDFIDKYIVANHIMHVVCGYDFQFGNQNQGNIETLKLCEKFDTTILDKVMYDNERISSTKIRSVIRSGQVDKLVPLLGKRYIISGKVIHGRRIGNKIGFPTANVDFQSYLLPHKGVYVVKLYCQQGVFMGMCNIGYNPTFCALDDLSLEVYILDFDADIYDQIVSVEFYKMIRMEKKFETQQQLINQLTNDCNEVREYFKNE